MYDLGEHAANSALTECTQAVYIDDTMPIERETIEVCVCAVKRCGHRWPKRGEELPARCAGCKSPYWNRDPKQVKPKKLRRAKPAKIEAEPKPVAVEPVASVVREAHHPRCPCAKCEKSRAKA